MTELAQRSFGIGSVIGQTLRITFRNILPFGLLVLVLQLPGFIFALSRSGDVPLQAIPLLGDVVVNHIVQLFLTMLLGAVVVSGTVQELRGQHASFGDIIARGRSAVMPVIEVVCYALIILMVGLFLLVVPIVIAAVMLWVVVPVAVLERPGRFASLRRSAELTRGSRWKIFALLLICVAVTIVNALILGLILGMDALVKALVLSLILGMDGMTGQVSTGFAVANYFTGSFLLLIGSVLGAVSYFELRNIREGVDIDEIAAVFD